MKSITVNSLKFYASTMSRLLILSFLSSLLLLSGCGQKKQTIEYENLDSWFSVPLLDKFFSQSALGSFLASPDGQNFKMPPKVKEENARVFFYRPHNTWGEQEWQAPKLYIDGEALFSLKSGGYTWVEIPPGERHIVGRRPMAFIQLIEIFELDLDLQAGQDYYIRYSEDDKLNMSKLLQSGDLYIDKESIQVIPARVGQYDINGTRYYTPGLYLGKKDDFDAYEDTLN